MALPPYVTNQQMTPNLGGNLPRGSQGIRPQSATMGRQGLLSGLMQAGAGPGIQPQMPQAPSVGMSPQPPAQPTMGKPGPMNPPAIGGPQTIPPAGIPPMQTATPATSPGAQAQRSGGLLNALRQQPLQSIPVGERGGAGMAMGTTRPGNDMAAFLKVMSMMLKPGAQR